MHRNEKVFNVLDIIDDFVIKPLNLRARMKFWVDNTPLVAVVSLVVVGGAGVAVELVSGIGVRVVVVTVSIDVVVVVLDDDGVAVVDDGVVAVVVTAGPVFEADVTSLVVVLLVTSVMVGSFSWMKGCYLFISNNDICPFFKTNA